MEGIADSLITWVKTFKVEAPHSTAAEICDGVALAQILSQIAPDYFNPIWLSKMKTASPDNWRLRQSNLKKVLKGILDYNMEVLGQQIMEFQIPNISEIAEKEDSTQLARLLQLILGCAVNCAKKQVYIEAIMGLEENVQQVVMNAIQELIMTEVPTAVAPDSFLELNEQLKRITHELRIANDAREQVTARCHELDMQVNMLQEEKNLLVSENEKMNERLNHIESLEDPSTVAGRRFQQMQHKLNILQDEVYHLETLRDEYKGKAELLEREVTDVQSKNEELLKFNDTMRTMKDELDVLRHKADKVESYEATIESYKKKLMDQSDLKRQIKKLEDTNTSYVERNMELEEEIKKLTLLKTQMDVFKKQSQELSSKLFEETRRADKSQFEAKRLAEKLDSLQKEKDRLISERNSMKETIEELKCMQVQIANEEMQENGSKRPEGILSDAEILDAVTPEIKERLIRLQHENNILKLKQNAADEQQVTFLQALLDDTKSRLSEVESENRLANQRIMELEGNIQDFQENQAASSSGVGAELRKQMGMMARKLEETEIELDRKKSSLEQIELDIQTKDQKLSVLQEQLSKRDDDIKQLKEKNDRYKLCLDKAQNIAKILDPEQSPDIIVLKNQLHEKDKIIANLERESQKEAAMREYESQLVTSAFYNMSAQLQRKTAEERLRQISPQPQTFLSRQRQATSKRLNLPGVATSLGSMKELYTKFFAEHL